jgi:hypothetical protein
VAEATGGRRAREAGCLAAVDGAAAVASILAAVLTEIYLCNVCSCQEMLRRNGRGQVRQVSGGGRAGGEALSVWTSFDERTQHQLRAAAAACAGHFRSCTRSMILAEIYLHHACVLVTEWRVGPPGRTGGGRWCARTAAARSTCSTSSS